MKKMFEPKEIIDPLTCKKRILSPEEQEIMLEKGIFLDIEDINIRGKKHDERV